MSPKFILKKTTETTTTTTTGFRQKKQKNKNLELHQTYLTQKLPKKNQLVEKETPLVPSMGFSSLGKKTHKNTKPSLPFPLHPWRLTWNIIMEVWKIIFLSKLVICRFHVNLPGCKTPFRPFSISIHHPTWLGINAPLPSGHHILRSGRSPSVTRFPDLAAGMRLLRGSSHTLSPLKTNECPLKINGWLVQMYSLLECSPLFRGHSLP